MLSSNIWELFIASNDSFEEFVPKLSLNGLMKLKIDLEKVPEDKEYLDVVEQVLQKRVVTLIGGVRRTVVSTMEE